MIWRKLQKMSGRYVFGPRESDTPFPKGVSTASVHHGDHHSIEYIAKNGVVILQFDCHNGYQRAQVMKRAIEEAQS